MGQGKFSAAVTDWVRETKERSTQVFRESAEEVVSIMQRSGPSAASTKAAIDKGIGSTGRGKNRKRIAGPVQAAGDGGAMPVDTGFLRASVRISKEAPIPIDKSARPVEGQSYSYSESAITLAILSAEIGEKLYVTYTASYARAVNYGAGSRPGYHFVDLAAQRWPQIVSANCAKLQGM